MKDLNVGLVGGAGFMGKAHSIAWATVPMYCWPAPVMPRRYAVAEMTEGLAKEASVRYGFERSYVGYEKLLADPKVDVVDICLPNYLHKEAVLAAINAGKHVICEKPLANDAADCKELLEAAEKAGILHQVGFNWRLPPAVQLAKKLIEEGELGQILDFRGFWLSEWGIDPDVPVSWRFEKSKCGSGSLGDIGGHIIDYARYLVGEFTEVSAVAETYIKERPLPGGGGAYGSKGHEERAMGKVDVDDNVAFMARFDNGGYGYLEATRFSPGRYNYAGFEIHGMKGSLFFNWERMDEIQFCSMADPAGQHGFRTIYPGPQQPGGDLFWPIPGYQISYADTKMLQMLDFCRAFADGKKVQTTFFDGWKNAEVIDAVLKSVEQHAWVQVGSPSSKS
jgi:predicted dehydrogenase